MGVILQSARVCGRLARSLFLGSSCCIYSKFSSAECPTTLSSCDELVLRLEQMQALLKTEPEEADDEIVDIVTVTPPCQKLKVKEEEQEADMEPKFFLGPCISAQFVSETAQQVSSSRKSARELNRLRPEFIVMLKSVCLRLG